MIKVCVAGVTGWTGSAVAKAVIESKEFELVGAVARKTAGEDAGEVLGVGKCGVVISSDIEGALSKSTDVVIEYTHAVSAKKNSVYALRNNARVVIGSSGLIAEDFRELDDLAREHNLGVIACGNFSVTAALAKRFALMAAQYLPSWEIIDYANSSKSDAPSGTTRELAEQMMEVKTNEIELAIENTVGLKESRGATVGGAQVHSVRLPGYTISFETLFGLPDEKLSIRHDAGTSPAPYVNGTLLATKKVMSTKGLLRGMDKIMFDQ